MNYQKEKINTLKEKYEKEIKPALKKELNLTNVMLVPKLVKIVVSMGAGVKFRDHKASAIEALSDDLARITGQRPKLTKTKKAIANFKSREGEPVGLMVTLRGDRMYQFAYKLINIVMPRVPDFRGVKLKRDSSGKVKGDGYGNLMFGLKEQTAFPEIDLDRLEFVQGMHINFVTTARDDEGCVALIKKLGLPIEMSEKERATAIEALGKEKA